MSFTHLRAYAWRARPLLAALAALCFLGAALEAIGGAAPATRPVLIAAHALEAGAEITAHDVTIADVPEALIPEGTLESAEEATGYRLAASLPSGMPIPHALLLTSSFAANAPGGTAIVAVPVVADASAELATTGTRVALYAPPDEYSEAGESTLVADGALILGISRQAGSSTLLGGTDASLTYFVAVPEERAPAVLGQASRHTLQIVLRRE